MDTQETTIAQGKQGETTQNKQVTIDVPGDRLAEFYAFYSRFLAGGGPGTRRRGRHGHSHGHGHAHGHERDGEERGGRHDEKACRQRASQIATERATMGAGETTSGVESAD